MANKPLDRAAQIADVFKSLGHPIRVGIILLLKKSGELSVNSICEALKTEQSLTSHHLNHLKKSGVIACKRQGKQIFYYLISKEALGLLGGAQKMI